MISKTGDIPPENEVKPSSSKSLLEQVLETGEVHVVLSTGTRYELHPYDTYVFADHVYSKMGDADVWFTLDDVVEVIRHYE